MTTLEAIMDVVKDNIHDEEPLDIVAKVLRSWEGKPCNIRLEREINTALRKRYNNVGHCLIRPTGDNPNYNHLELIFWVDSYVTRKTIKLAKENNRNATLKMEYVIKENKYYFGLMQESNQDYDNAVKQEGELDELANLLDEYKRFISGLNQFFSTTKVKYLKSQILRKLNINCGDI